MRRYASALILLIVLAASPALMAESTWAARYVEARRAFNAGDFATCLQAAKDAYERAADDRRRGIAVLGARCAAGAGDRPGFEDWSTRAGDKLSEEERRRLEELLASPPLSSGEVQVEREQSGDVEPARSTPALTQETVAEPATHVGSIWTSLGLGTVLVSGTAYRAHASIELGGAWHLGPARIDLALAETVEPPLALYVRPGLRAFLGPVYGRLAYQFASALDSSGVRSHGALFGLGGIVRLGGAWFMTLEADVSVWFSAISVVPVEGRAGLGWAW
jgi:hypothetical protein